MPKFRFHWLDGKLDDGEGAGAADALNRLGYGAGAVRALDYWEMLTPASDGEEAATNANT